MFVLLSLSFFVSALGAEVVLLRNGQTITGQISGQSARGILIVTDTGVRTINKADLVKIQYVAFTQAQKDTYLSDIRRRRAAEQARLARIRTAKLAETEREKQLAAEEARIQAAKEQEAKDRAARAEALRDLVEKGKMEKPADEPISYWDFAWRSLVLPGWGHFKLDRPVIGSLYIGATAGLLYGVYETRRRARAAVNENRGQVETNFLLSVQPSLATLEIRTLYAYYSNARAYLPIEKKVSNYHGALYSLGVFYGLQVLHIIWNGIAWEKGLLIVREDAPERGRPRPEIAIVPDGHDESTAGARHAAHGNALRLGVSWHF